MKKETVILRRCSECGPDRASTINGEGLEAFGLGARIKGGPPKPKVIVPWLFLRAGILSLLFRLDLIIDSHSFFFLSGMRRIVNERP